MKHSLINSCSVLAVFGALVGSVAYADVTNDSGTKVLQSDSRTATLQIDPNRNSVQVQLWHGSESDPKSIQLTLYDENSRPLTFQLNALSLPNSQESNFSTYAGMLPNRSSASETSGGGLSSGQQSFVGFEIRIPLSRGESDVLQVRPSN